MITTAELSKILGISRGTISRVLNNNPNVNEKTRQTVLNALKEYNYSPNHAARSLIMKRQLKIGVVVFSKPRFFWEQIRRGVDEAAASLTHTGLQVDFFSTDINRPEEQIETVNRLLEEGYDAIALAPNDPGVMGDVIDKTIRQGIPVLLFNVDMPNSNRLCYVGSDYFQSGKLAAEIIAKACPKEKSNVTVFTIRDMIMPLEQRITGFRTAIAEWENLTINHISCFRRTDDEVYTAACDLLRKGNTDAVFVNFDAVVEVAKAVTDLCLIGKVVVVGYDLNSTIANYIKTGAITATIFHDPFSQGFNAVSMLQKFLYDKQTPEKSFNYTKLEILMRYNVVYYLDSIQ